MAILIIWPIEGSHDFGPQCSFLSRTHYIPFGFSAVRCFVQIILRLKQQVALPAHYLCQAIKNLLAV
jgi:hypothetical protein